jgi:glutathione S-transferase
MTKTNTLKLYGSALSLYAGRARSYLIKAGIDYSEVIPNTSYYAKTVLPKAGGRQSMPTIELADGTVVRDGAAIIDYFENTSGHGFSPSSPKQRILSLLFDVIGAEGLLRPAMHYRWNFAEENLKYLEFHFESMMPDTPNRKESGLAAANRMRSAAIGFGVVPSTMQLIETLYAELMTKLNNHFAQQPYLLGGKPCIGDFGMMAPLYGHLGRDPKPLAMMQQKAIRLFRWVERMNRPDADMGEFASSEADYLPDDKVASTLIELLKHIAIDFIPETRAAADLINTWLSEHTDLEPNTQLPRGVGNCEFEMRGSKISALAQPYRFYLLKRVQDEFAGLYAADKLEVQSMLSACNMSEILDIKLNRDIGRHNNLEVWA